MDERSELRILDGAARVGVHPQTLIRAIHDGRLRATKRFGKWWISQLELARFVDASAKDSHPAAETAEERVG